MKNFKWFIGIDISKATLDMCLTDGKTVYAEVKATNQEKEIKQRLRQWQKEFNLKTEEVLLCAEYTGNYIYPLVWGAHSLKLALWLEPGGQIKQSLGILRGKDDKIDARRIAGYSYRYQDRVRLFTMNDEHLTELKFLLSERNGYVTERAKYIMQIKESTQFMKPAVQKGREKRMKEVVSLLSKCIRETEKKMEKILSNQEVLSKQYDLLLSIPGVGKQTALETIVATEGFTRFTNARKFICHAGIAPFTYTSGTSQRSLARVSHRANKKLKSLFHLVAIRVIRLKGELSEYYKRKVADGKAKMLVINAIRSKIILRIFAVIKHNRPYQENYINNLLLS
ncbi:MAG: IS110 family transposase [Patescibacteria group bacterium]|nr:IS110 family transposase [Patescibacteria group bacterium]